MGDPRHGVAISAEPRRVAVVIPTWNGGARFRECLAALARQDVEGGLQLVVIDSGSTDGTGELALAAGARVLAIPQREFQHGRTRNAAIAATRAEVVCLLTQDAVPLDAHYVRALAAAFDDPAVDGAYARQFPRPGQDPLLAERLRRWSASRTEPARQSLAPGDPAAARARFDALPPLERYLACAFDNVASAVRRATWERVPLPESPFGEDVAWAREVLLAGGTLAFVPDARVEHSHAISIRREFKRLYCDHWNLQRLFGLRNVASWAAVRAGWRWQVREYARLLDSVEGLSAPRRLWWKAYSVPYALAETTAQFLGARSGWKARESAFWRTVDRRVRRGV